MNYHFVALDSRALIIYNYNIYIFINIFFGRPLPMYEVICKFPM
jgi:hypothetical protein